MTDRPPAVSLWTGLCACSSLSSVWSVCTAWTATNAWQCTNPAHLPRECKPCKALQTPKFPCCLLQTSSLEGRIGLQCTPPVHNILYYIGPRQIPLTSIERRMQPSSRAESVSQGRCCQHVAMHAAPDALLSNPSELRVCHKEAAANMLRCMLRRMLSFPIPASLMLAMLTFLNPPVPKYRLIRAPMSSYDTSAYVTCVQQPLLVQHEYIQLLRSLISL